MAQASGPESHPGVLVATGLGLFMIFLDATIVNVALPDIQAEFSAGESGVQWVVAAYSLTMAMFIMSGATFADVRGRRLAYLVGIGIFCAASLGCALAPELLVLNVSRGLQGVGAAVVNVASLALVGAAFADPQAKTRAIGAWTGIAAVGLAIGPSLGGVLTQELGWRWVFAINPIIGIVAVVLTLRLVDESRDPVDHRFDPAGQALFIGGVGALTYVLVQGPQAGWLSPEILGLGAAAVVLVVAFVRVELHSADPMMDVRVFADRVYTAAIVTVVGVLFCVYGTLLIITQYFQNIEGLDPIETGAVMLAMTLPTVILAPVAGRLAARIGGRRPALVGVGSVIAGMTVLAATTGGPIPFTMVGLALVGSAGGLAIAPSTGIAMGSIPPGRSGMASGILSAQRALGSTAGFAIMGTIMAAVVGLTLSADLTDDLPDPTQRAEVVAAVEDAANPEAVASIIGPATGLPDTVTESDELEGAADRAFVAGIRVAMLSGLLVGLVALVVGWRQFPREHGDDGDDEVEVDEATALAVDEAVRRSEASADGGSAESGAADRR